MEQLNGILRDEEKSDFGFSSLLISHLDESESEYDIINDNDELSETCLRRCNEKGEVVDALLILPSSSCYSLIDGQKKTYTYDGGDIVYPSLCVWSQEEKDFLHSIVDCDRGNVLFCGGLVTRSVINKNYEPCDYLGSILIKNQYQSNLCKILSIIRKMGYAISEFLTCPRYSAFILGRGNEDKCLFIANEGETLESWFSYLNDSDCVYLAGSDCGMYNILFSRRFQFAHKHHCSLIRSHQRSFLHMTVFVCHRSYGFFPLLLEKSYLSKSYITDAMMKGHHDKSDIATLIYYLWIEKDSSLCLYNESKNNKGIEGEIRYCVSAEEICSLRQRTHPDLYPTPFYY